MMVILGDRLGLYRALSPFGPMTSEELAQRTNIAERYIREWLASQAAAGYLTYDPENKKFSLSAENAMFWQMKTARHIYLAAIRF